MLLVRTYVLAPGVAALPAAATTAVPPPPPPFAAVPLLLLPRVVAPMLELRRTPPPPAVPGVPPLERPLLARRCSRSCRTASDLASARRQYAAVRWLASP